MLLCDIYMMPSPLYSEKGKKVTLFFQLFDEKVLI